MKYQRHFFWVMVVLAIVTMQACSKNTSESGTGTTAAKTGSMAISFTDAPGEYDHVWITVKDIWFHTSNAAGPGEGGWLKYPLEETKTVDLLTLGNGNTQSIWDNIILPIGDYQQIRLVLVDTGDPLTTSAEAVNLKYNNEVVSGGEEYPLRIPTARHGIGLIGHFSVTEGAVLRLAIDFDVAHDVVEFRHGEEFILKPRLRYFDLDHVGAVIGRIDTSAAATHPGSRFVIKAETLSHDGTHYVVRRWTVPRSDGTFILYPLSAITTTNYDIMLRGLDYRTVIIKNVPVTEGATLTSGATDIGTITMTAATTQDFRVNGTIESPTGAWVNFYQTLPDTDEKPYHVRYRHFHPLTGSFADYPLSSEPLQVGTYGSLPISLATVTPVEGVGMFKAAANAILYDWSEYPDLISETSPTVTFVPLSVKSPWMGNSVSGSITMSEPNKMNNIMNKGVLFAVHRGMIVTAISVDTQMATGGTYTMTNLPGGTPANPLPRAFYGIEAVGWSESLPFWHKAVASPKIVDLRTGNASADMNMVPFW